MFIIEKNIFVYSETRLKTLTPMSDQDRISPYNIQISDENKEKYQFGDNNAIQYQIIRTNIICKNCMVDRKEN